MDTNNFFSKNGTERDDIFNKPNHNTSMKLMTMQV